ncbi:protein REGULATOR OF FATTY ACID COMPOSITION 3, chloroplastic [Salvia miltiorrhiza]|uniref:protein REGULATOR OF FATTY ACID COMPOSITION 3, chloroplastic n=1 Tax=Salvia miltiorrhiza TaxID=226208 RepID=UPI0025AD5864|nr:protein REGULATOR OF FATTY ACID COMPOSITION 3, chloroplastic [Salvia miltiorrhiza]
MASIALKSTQLGINCIPNSNINRCKSANFSSSFSCSSQLFSPKLKLRSNSTVTAAAKKENKPKKKRKEDSHSFISRPDEATGPFPEAVLLKQRNVEEDDGRLMPEFADVEERELFEALNLLLESDTDVDQRRHYEVVYLIHEDHKDEVENVNTKVQEFLKEKKGKIWRFSDWGMRRLAYKIKKAKNAHYILMNFEVEARWINDFKSLLDKDERVIRHLVMKRDKAETDDCPPPPEFGTLRADMVDDDDDDDIDDEEEEEYDDEDGGNDGEDDQGIIYVNDVEEESSSSLSNTPKPHKVGR